MVPGDLIDLLTDLGAALKSAKIEYAVGGALALGFWGEPRGTRDIDVTVYVPVERLETVFLLLEGLGGAVERDVCRWELSTSGYFSVDFDIHRIDVFLPDTELHERAFPRRVAFQLGDAKISFLSAEDTLLFKLIFFRDKDKLDMRTILQVQRDRLDLDYIRTALAELIRDEERSSWFEGQVREMEPPE